MALLPDFRGVGGERRQHTLAAIAGERRKRQIDIQEQDHGRTTTGAAPRSCQHLLVRRACASCPPCGSRQEKQARRF